jgi:hypothetical protein
MSNSNNVAEKMTKRLKKEKKSLQETRKYEINPEDQVSINERIWVIDALLVNHYSVSVSGAN